MNFGINLIFLNHDAKNRYSLSIMVFEKQLYALSSLKMKATLPFSYHSRRPTCWTRSKGCFCLDRPPVGKIPTLPSNSSLHTVHCLSIAILRPLFSIHPKFPVLVAVVLSKIIFFGQNHFEKLYFVETKFRLSTKKKSYTARFQ